MSKSLTLMLAEAQHMLLDRVGVVGVGRNCAGKIAVLLERNDTPTRELVTLWAKKRRQQVVVRVIGNIDPPAR